MLRRPGPTRRRGANTSRAALDHHVDPMNTQSSKPPLRGIMADQLEPAGDAILDRHPQARAGGQYRASVHVPGRDGEDMKLGSA